MNLTNICRMGNGTTYLLPELIRPDFLDRRSVRTRCCQGVGHMGTLRIVDKESIRIRVFLNERKYQCHLTKNVKGVYEGLSLCLVSTLIPS